MTLRSWIHAIIAGAIAVPIRGLGPGDVASSIRSRVPVYHSDRRCPLARGGATLLWGETSRLADLSGRQCARAAVRRRGRRHVSRREGGWLGGWSASWHRPEWSLSIHTRLRAPRRSVAASVDA